MTLKKGWLGRQFDRVTNDVQAWPEWMKIEAGFKTPQSHPYEHAEQSPPREQTQGDKTVKVQTKNA